MTQRPSGTNSYFGTLFGLQKEILNTSHFPSHIQTNTFRTGSICIMHCLVSGVTPWCTSGARWVSVSCPMTLWVTMGVLTESQISRPGDTSEPQVPKRESIGKAKLFSVTDKIGVFQTPPYFLLTWGNCLVKSLVQVDMFSNKICKKSCKRKKASHNEYFLVISH